MLANDDHKRWCKGLWVYYCFFKDNPFLNFSDQMSVGFFLLARKKPTTSLSQTF